MNHSTNASYHAYITQCITLDTCTQCTSVLVEPVLISCKLSQIHLDLAQIDALSGEDRNCFHKLQTTRLSDITLYHCTTECLNWKVNPFSLCLLDDYVRFSKQSWYIAILLRSHATTVLSQDMFNRKPMPITKHCHPYRIILQSCQTLC